ncbi:His/Gly/Thr/Pro-type tRNA ligase C-terminal domain-containing protein [Oscillochloris sp. ZM17-4]|uniref:His/Gly/Thr/Pro-type tRNA ligase C-terminal domain-containing protein n=1 Tax=Oscillochloris sp. ZM17-4 TaxID=2866714 RepID=UPI0021059964|nr:His/Gly/Thr/Pro-type tRNA ligase C-terminal domain-containing protein [Oscillochloris sp. ZM17-4]
MEELEIGPRPATTAVAYVTVFGPEQAAASLELARELRAGGVNTLISLDSGGLGKQLKDADRKGVRYALVLGPDEIARGEVVVKDLRGGGQRAVPRAEALAAIAR